MNYKDKLFVICFSIIVCFFKYSFSLNSHDINKFSEKTFFAFSTEF